jgi:hypothetical protein
MKTCPSCGQKVDEVFRTCLPCGSKLPDQTVNEIVTEWFAGEHTMFDAVQDTPEVAWGAILKILEQELTWEQLALLAAGPLEDLLSDHGNQFIERVEREAERNPRFNYLLGGVWQAQMPQELWERVRKARKEAW